MTSTIVARIRVAALYLGAFGLPILLVLITGGAR